MIGTLEDATLATTLGYGDPEFLADGSTRAAFLINGVVYKVDMCGDMAPTNEYEYSRIRRTALPDGVFFPKTELYDVDGTFVIAMEYIEGQIMHECWGECTPHYPECMTTEVLDKVGPVLDDTGGDNVIVNDEGIWIIDMG